MTYNLTVGNDKNSTQIPDNNILIIFITVNNNILTKMWVYLLTM